ncbi:MAG: glutamate 5-kinase [Rhodopirellula sp.]|nr:glutamate 5-kinase [Rhodopirellula sp.]HCA50887.1 glutamate 5-kinase [Planctomycetaceae bacterium]|tara:strand:+ start:18281 stop:19417 length:1137 start_codon:yes stop_codon:yes gene_type:complete
MSDLLRQEVTATAEKIVVKVGTRVLTDAQGKLDLQRMNALANQLVAIADSGRQVVLVSSGAVGAGMNRLSMETRPTDVATLQAIAAVGQTDLMQTYQKLFQEQGRLAAQVLLTANELDDRVSYLNVRNTLLELLELQVIPVVNENDTVSVDELQTTFGDNDQLAGLVTNLLGAQLLIILSDVDGLFTGNPEDDTSELVPTVISLDETIAGYVQESSGGLGTGGMGSKLQAVRMVTSAGENAVIANGRESEVLTRILAGESLGTLFVAEGKTLSPWKRWLRFSAQTQGTIMLDKGACAAIQQEGSSLLAIGIIRHQGHFNKGDVIQLCNEAGEELARGLTNYNSDELEQIRGHRSEEFQQILGQCPYEEVIHRDNLALV